MEYNPEEATEVISSQEKSNPLFVYTNPNNGGFRINLEEGPQKEVRIYDAKGRIVYQSSTNNNELILDSFLPGMYYVTVESESSIQSNKVLIK